jgi:hypothetical protein
MQDGGAGVSDLFSAILNPSGPNFEEWNQVLGSHRVPLESPQSVMATLAGEKPEVECYLIALKALTLRQRANLSAHLARKFRVTIDEVEHKLQMEGMPIRAADVIVSFDMRAFV